MIRAAIVGLGWWGRTLVEAVNNQSDDIRFVAGATRTVTPEVQAFAVAQAFQLAGSYDALLADPATVTSASSHAYSPTFSIGTLSIVTWFLPVPISAVVGIFCTSK